MAKGLCAHDWLFGKHNTVTVGNPAYFSSLVTPTSVDPTVKIYDNLLNAEESKGDNPEYTIGGDDPVWKDDDGTDISAVRTGYVSVTPLHLDLTHYKAVVEMERWRFSL